MRASWLPYQSPSRSKTVAGKQKATFGLGCPLLFHWLALGAALGLVFVSAVFHILTLLVLAVFLLLLGTVSWFWSRQSLQGLSLKATLSRTRAFPGEAVDLTLELVNGKRLPLTWLEVEEQLPHRLATGVLRSPSPYTRERLRWTTSVSGGQSVKQTHRVECKARGDYRLGPVRLRSGDVFGLYPREMVLPCFEQLLVYPRIVPVDKLSLPLRQLMGEKGVPRSMYEDVSRTIGARDYHHDDPFKRIHWKASARHSHLQARQYESTTSLSLLLVLDVYSFCGPEGENIEDFETAVSTAASLAYEAHREGSSVGLIANSAPEIRIPVSAGRGNLLAILEVLARVRPQAQLPLHRYLDRDMATLPLGATLLIITRVPSPALTGLVQKLSRRGHSVLSAPVGNNMSELDDHAIPPISVGSRRNSTLSSIGP